MKTDILLSINRSTGIEPTNSKIYIRKIRYMNDNYPTIVCLECLEEAWKDTKTFDGRTGQWSGAYSVYGGNCDVCKCFKNKCTEPRDAGYPNFKYATQRLRIKKIKKIMENEDIKK